MHRSPVLMRLGVAKRCPAVRLHQEGRCRQGRHVGVAWGNPRLAMSVRSKGKRRPAVRVRPVAGKRPQALRVLPEEWEAPSATPNHVHELAPGALVLPPCAMDKNRTL